MAPFNLSEFAVKEIKIPSPQLRPAQTKSFLGRYLASHLLDFWALVWMNATATYIFKMTFQSFMSTNKLNNAWDMVNFSRAAGFTFIAFSLIYFFTCYSMNHGQTWGMKVMKCRVRMKEHSFSDAVAWTLKSAVTYATLGFATNKFAHSIVAHDHLWHELIIQKEMRAPDVRTLATKVNEEEEFVEAA